MRRRKIIITKLLQKEHILTDVECGSWEELVDIAGKPLIDNGLIEQRYLQFVKNAVAQYGAYMVLIDDIAFFHARPEDGVRELAMSLALLKTPVYLLEKRIKAAFMFAAVDNNSHLGLLKELSWSMNDETFIKLLLDGKDHDAIIQKFEEAEIRYEIS